MQRMVKTRIVVANNIVERLKCYSMAWLLKVWLLKIELLKVSSQERCKREGFVFIGAKKNYSVCKKMRVN